MENFSSSLEENFVHFLDKGDPGTVQDDQSNSLNEVKDISAISPQEIIELLRKQLNRRNILLEAIRKAYYRDIVIVKEELLQKKKQSNYEPNESIHALPSVDLRDTLKLFAPEESYLRLHPCETCGGTLEIIHAETDAIKKLMAAAAIAESVERSNNQKIVKLTDDLEQANEMIEALRRRVGTSKKENEFALDKLKYMTQQAHEHKRAYGDLMIRMKQIEMDREQLEKMTNEVSTLKSKLKQSTENANILAHDAERFQEKFREVCHQRDTLAEMKAKQEIVLDEKKIEIHRLEEDISKMQKSNDKANQEANELVSQASRLKLALEVSREEQAALKKTLDQTQRKMEDAVRMDAKSEDALHQKLLEVRKNETKLKNRVRELEEKLALNSKKTKVEHEVLENHNNIQSYHDKSLPLPHMKHSSGKNSLFHQDFEKKPDTLFYEDLESKTDCSPDSLQMMNTSLVAFDPPKPLRQLTRLSTVKTSNDVFSTTDLNKDQDKATTLGEIAKTFCEISLSNTLNHSSCVRCNLLENQYNSCCTQLEQIKSELQCQEKKKGDWEVKEKQLQQEIRILRIRQHFGKDRNPSTELTNSIEVDRTKQLEAALATNSQHEMEIEILSNSKRQLETTFRDLLVHVGKVSANPALIKRLEDDRAITQEHCAAGKCSEEEGKKKLDWKADEFDNTAKMVLNEIQFILTRKISLEAKVGLLEIAEKKLTSELHAERKKVNDLQNSVQKAKQLILEANNSTSRMKEQNKKHDEELRKVKEEHLKSTLEIKKNQDEKEILSLTIMENTLFIQREKNENMQLKKLLSETKSELNQCVLMRDFYCRQLEDYNETEKLRLATNVNIGVSAVPSIEEIGVQTERWKPPGLELRQRNSPYCCPSFYKSHTTVSIHSYLKDQNDGFAEKTSNNPDQSLRSKSTSLSLGKLDKSRVSVRTMNSLPEVHLRTSSSSNDIHLVKPSNSNNNFFSKGNKSERDLYFE